MELTPILIYTWHDMAHDRGGWYKAYTGRVTIIVTINPPTILVEVRCDEYKSSRQDSS